MATSMRYSPSSRTLLNPVTVIQGMAATLRSSMDRMEPDTVRTSIEIMERSARDLGTLVRPSPTLERSRPGH